MNKTKTAIIAGAGFYWLYRWITYQIFMEFIVLSHGGGELGALYSVKTKSAGQYRTVISIHYGVHTLPRSPLKTLST
jgi:hypothetical protein